MAKEPDTTKMETPMKAHGLTICHTVKVIPIEPQIDPSNRVFGLKACW